MSGRKQPPKSAEDREAFVVGWCASEDEMEAADMGTHDSLCSLLGDRQTGPVRWVHLSGDEANTALDEMVANPLSTPKMFDHYRRIRAMLREEGGYLVVAHAKGRVG